MLPLARMINTCKVVTPGKEKLNLSQEQIMMNSLVLDGGNLYTIFPEGMNPQQKINVGNYFPGLNNLMYVAYYLKYGLSIQIILFSVGNCVAGWGKMQS